MSGTSSRRLRVAAIRFLNPAPLLYGLEHGPQGPELAARYELSYTSPAGCAELLRTGDADLGLVPIGALPFLPELRVVRHCTIASLHAVRSIQLIVKPGIRLHQVRSVAADEVSRSSAAYARILFRTFYGNDPAFDHMPAVPGAMLTDHDAALVIGDPALFALQARDDHGFLQDHQWFDLATLWRQHTGLPWVAAVWAVHPEALQVTGISATQLTDDLVASRDAGLRGVESIVEEWSGRMALPPDTIRDYLTRNIHYRLDDPCLQGIERFFKLAEHANVLPAYHLEFLATE